MFDFVRNEGGKSILFWVRCLEDDKKTQSDAAQRAAEAKALTGWKRQRRASSTSEKKQTSAVAASSSEQIATAVAGGAGVYWYGWDSEQGLAFRGSPTLPTPEYSRDLKIPDGANDSDGVIAAWADGTEAVLPDFTVGEFKVMLNSRKGRNKNIDSALGRCPCQKRQGDRLEGQGRQNPLAEFD